MRIVVERNIDFLKTSLHKVKKSSFLLKIFRNAHQLLVEMKECVCEQARKLHMHLQSWFYWKSLRDRCYD